MRKTIFMAIVCFALVAIFVAGILFREYFPVIGLGIASIVGIIFGIGKRPKPRTDTEAIDAADKQLSAASGKVDNTIGTMDGLVQEGESLVREGDNLLEQSEELLHEARGGNEKSP